MKRLVLIEIAIIFICCACRKYEDGPWFSLTSPEKRVIGKWEIVKVLIDDIDKTSIIDSLNIDCYKFVYDKDLVNSGHVGSGDFEIYDNQGKINNCNSLVWGLSNDEKTLFFLTTSTPNNLHPIAFLPCYFNFTNDNTYIENWKVFRLTKKEMILNNAKWGVNIKIHFEKT